MLYTLQFRNLKEELYTIQIQTGNIATPYSGTLQCGDPACVIKADSSELYAPIKSRSCTINLVVHDYIFNLYSKTPKNTKVWVYDKNSTCIFFGYLTPAAYNQSYTYLDTLTLEAVDAVSVLKDIPFDTANRNMQLNFKDLICSLLNIAGYSGNVYIPNTYDRLDGDVVSHVTEQLYISGGNFFGDDDQHLPLNDYDVLTEILRFMGCSLCPFGNDVWLIDYRAESQGQVTFKRYSISTGNPVTVNGSTTITKNDVITISQSNEAAGVPQISMDDIYNTITVSSNLFEINELAPDLSEDTLHDSVTEIIESKTGSSALTISQWFKERRKEFLWWSWGTGEERIPGIEYQTICAFNSNSGFTHKFYHKYESNTSTHSHLENITDYGTWAGCNWYDTSTSSQFQGNRINQYVNTVGALMQHHATVPENEAGSLPTSISWDDILTFYILGDNVTNPTLLSVDNIRGFELPVLEYNISEDLNYLPRTGTNWFVIKGDMWLQASSKVEIDNKNFQLNLFKDPDSSQTNGEYVTCPVEKPEGVDNVPYLSWSRLPGEPSLDGGTYGEGWGMWKMRLKVGDCFWTTDYGWCTQAYWNNHKTSAQLSKDPEPYFVINYNNGPDGNEAETLSMFEWMKTVDTSNYKDRVGEDGYCIPIPSDVTVKKQSGENPTFIGKLKLTIYTPSILPIGLGLSADARVSWKDLPPVIYIKDFDFNYVYVNSQTWYKQHNKSYKDDYIYTGFIDANITKKFSGLNLKVNTALTESPISRSFVCKSNGYISTMRHSTYSSGSGQIQEKNILDQYLDHYKEPKPIYEVTLHGDVAPWYRYEYPYLTDDNGNEYNLLLDSYEMDLKYCKNRLKLIAF